MQITFDPRELTQGQLEALAGFLMNFNDPCIVDRQNMQDASDSLIDKADAIFASIEKIESDISAAENIVSDIPSAEEAFGASIADDESKESWANKTSEQVKADIEFMLEPIATPTNPHLDKNGLPWDDRIHSGSRARNADGSWRYKRGVADTWVVEVEKELRNLMAIPAPPQRTVIVELPVSVNAQVATSIESSINDGEGNPVSVSVTGPNSIAVSLAPPPPQVPAIPPVPAVPAVPSPVPLASPVSSSPSVPPPPPPAASSEGPFVTLVKKVGALIPAGKLTQEEAKAACMAVGVNELYLLSNRHDLCPQVDAAIDAIVAGR